MILNGSNLFNCVSGYVLFNSYSIVGVTKNNTEEEVEEQEELTVPIGK